MNKVRLAVLFAFVLGGLGLVARMAQADGAFQPVLSPNTTGGQYLFPTTPAPAGGGMLVNDSVGTFRWSNTVVTSTNPYTALQIPALPSMTLALINLTVPQVVGQMVFCSNCVNTTICVSSGTAIAAWVSTSSGTVIGHCN